MLNKKRLIVLLSLSWVLGGPCFAISNSSPARLEKDPAPTNVQPRADETRFDRLKKILGITYFSFFYGPGIHPENRDYNPNQLGNPQSDGIYFQNQVSFRYKFSSRFALDLQSRFNFILNNSTKNEDYRCIRWEAPRIGISGLLASGEDWSLVGVVNTDFPYFFPEPFTGYQAQKRTVIFNPGMFASFKYEPKNSRWSIFSVVTPRYFFYTDRDVADPQMLKSGMIAQNKPELIVSFLPTLNYRLTDRAKLTLGASIDYRKQVISSWNPFNWSKESLLSNGYSRAWRLYAIPISMGVSYSFSESFVIFPFLSYYPIAIQRKDAVTGNHASFFKSASFGMWISGTLF